MTAASQSKQNESGAGMHFIVRFVKIKAKGQASSLTLGYLPLPENLIYYQ